MLVAGGSTDVTTYFVLRLAATGVAATGLTVTTFDLQYVRSGAAPSAKVDAVALTGGTPAAAAHSDNGATEVDATDQPGLYRVDWPDAAFAAGVREVILSVKCATAFTEHLRVEIDGEVGSVSGAVGSLTGHTVQTGDTYALANGAAGFAAINTDVEAILVDTNELQTDWVNGGRLDALVDTIKAETATIVADTNELQTDWVNGGRLDALIDTIDTVVDAIKVDTAAILIDTAELQSDNIPSTLSAITTAVVSGAAGANIAADIIALKAETATIVADTNELQGDWANSGRLDLLLDATLADTNELQIDWANSGRLDALVDSIKAETVLIVEDTGTTVPALIATLDAVVDTVKAETVLIVEDTGTTLPALIAALNDVSTAQVNAEVDAALVGIHLDHLFAEVYDPASKPGNATALLNELVEDDSGVSRFTTNALENAPSGGASALAIADAVWDEAQSGHVAVGSFGILATEIADILVDTDATVPGLIATLDAVVDTVKVDTAAILLDTAELQSDNIPGSLSALDGKIDTIDNFLDTEIAAITTAVITAAAGANIAADIIALKAETVLIVEDTGTTVPGLINGLNDVSTAEVNAQVDAAIETYHLHYLFHTDYNPASKPGTATALLNEIVESDSGVSRFTVNALENGPTGSGASAATIADAVWDELQTDHVVAGTFGIIASEIATIDWRVTTVDGIVDTILLDTAELQTDNVPGLISTLSGKVDTVDGIVDDILVDTSATLDTKINTIDTVVDAIKAKTDSLTFNGTDLAANVTKWLGTAVTAAIAGEPNVNINRIKASGTPATVLNNWLNQARTGTASSGTTTTLRDTGVLVEGDDAWIGATLVITGGQNQYHTAVVTDFDDSTDSVTFAPAMPVQIDDTSQYVLIPGTGHANVEAWRGEVPDVLNNGDVASDMKRVNGASGPAIVLSNWLNTGSHSGWASGGSTTTLIDLGVLTRADNAYRGGLLIITSGANQYFSTTITSSDSATATVTFAPALPSAIDATSAYTIVPGLGHVNLAALEAKIDTIDDFLDTEIAAITTAVITGATGANIAADIIALKAETVLIVEDTGTTLPGLVNGLNDVSTAEVNAQVDAALVDIHLDQLFATDYDPASKPGVTTALLNELIESDGGVSRFTENALENGPTGSGATAAAIADAVWDETSSEHDNAGSFGGILHPPGGLSRKL